MTNLRPLAHVLTIVLVALSLALPATTLGGARETPEGAAHDALLSEDTTPEAEDETETAEPEETVEVPEDEPEDDASSGNTGSGSGDSEDNSNDDETDEPGSDDSGADDSVDDGKDDDSGDDGGNDDSGKDDNYVPEIDDSADGVSVPVVDNDGNAATDGFRAGQAVVRLQPGASIDEFNARHSTTTVAAAGNHDLYLLQLPAGVPEEESERQLSNDPETRWSELNYVNQAPEGRPGYFFTSGEASDEAGTAYTPALLGFESAQSCSTGKGIIVAVLDTGIDATHPALATRVSPDGWNALNGTTDVADIGNGLDDDADGLVDEMVGHGTHVAGIIAQVAPGALILPIKVLGSDGVGDAFYVAAGIHYAVDHGAQVINLSLSSTYDARVIAEAVAEANEAGVVVVAAAGNNATNRVLEFPAANTGVVGVAATDQADIKGAFSNYGDRIDLSAPGVEIVSSLPGGRYAAWSGTSMAAPFVAGAAALIASAHPSWSSPRITERLTKTATEIDDLNPAYAGDLGAGRLDIAAAVGCQSTETARTSGASS